MGERSDIRGIERLFLQDASGPCGVMSKRRGVLCSRKSGSRTNTVYFVGRTDGGPDRNVTFANVQGAYH